MREKVVVLAILSLLLVAFWAIPVHANGIPSLPHALYGSVTINGDAAPDGTQVSATVDQGTILPTQNPVTTVGGSYGINSPKLLVQGDDLEGAITFYVNDIVVEGAVATFEVGGGPSEMKLGLVITDESITGKVVETVSAGQTDYVIDASDIADTTITADTTDEVTVTVKKYYSNPHPEVILPAETEMLPRYIDIEVDNPDAIDWPMHVEQTYTDAEVAGFDDESSLGMYYFAGAWHRCSDTGVYTATNTVWANIWEEELPGSPVAIGGIVAPSPPPIPPTPTGGGGGGPAISVPSLSGLTATPPLEMSAEGEVQRTCKLQSADEKLTLYVAAGTRLADPQGLRLRSLTAAPELSPPAPPSGKAIVAAYDFGPDGATFKPPITSTWSYSPDTLPEGVAEEGLVIAYYKVATGEWVELPSTIDPVAHTITASVSHFTTFAIIGAIIPPAPAVFSLSDLSIQPAEVKPGEAVAIAVVVSNTGESEGSYTVTLNINGPKEAEKTVTIAGGEKETVLFPVTREEPNIYSVTVNGLEGSFTVVSPPAPPPSTKPTMWPWPLAGWIVGGAVAVILFVLFVVKLIRRRLD